MALGLREAGAGAGPDDRELRVPVLDEGTAGRVVLPETGQSVGQRVGRWRHLCHYAGSWGFEHLFSAEPGCSFSSCHAEGHLCGWPSCHIKGKRGCCAVPAVAPPQGREGDRPV